MFIAAAAILNNKDKERYVTERSSSCRLEPLSVHDLSGEQRLLAEKILKFSLNGLNGPFNMMLRSPEAAEILLSLGNYLRFRTSIPPRLVEFADRKSTR